MDYSGSRKLVLFVIALYHKQCNATHPSGALSLAAQNIPTTSRRSPKQISPFIVSITVVFSFLLLFILLSVVCCFISYRNAPEPDHAQGIINRRLLEEEFQNEQNLLGQRGYLDQPPPPPYFPKPPVYSSYELLPTSISGSPSLACSDLESPRPSPTRPRMSLSMYVD